MSGSVLMAFFSTGLGWVPKNSITETTATDSIYRLKVRPVGQPAMSKHRTELKSNDLTQHIWLVSSRK